MLDTDPVAVASPSLGGEEESLFASLDVANGPFSGYSTFIDILSRLCL